MALVMISNFGRADGGRETWAYQFLPRLLERKPNLHVEVCGLRVDGQEDNSEELRQAIAEPERDRFDLAFLSAPRNKMPNSLDMIRAIRRSSWPSARPDLALGVGSFVELLAMMAAPGLRRVPKAIWLRTIYVDEKAERIPGKLRPFARAVETAVLGRADLIFANGEDTADHYRRRGLTVEVIANAVDLERWRMPPPAFDVPLDVAFIGRLTAVKGVQEFVELCRRAADSALAGQVRFHVVGEGEFAPAAKELAERGLLTFHGPIDNRRMPEFLSAMDCAVALTFTDPAGRGQSGGAGVSNALLEQMAAGRLIIAWGNRCYSPVVRKDEGILVQQGSVDGLLTALEQAVSQPGRMRQMAAAGQARAGAFGWDEQMTKFETAVRRFFPG